MSQAPDLHDPSDGAAATARSAVAAARPQSLPPPLSPRSLQLARQERQRDRERQGQDRERLEQVLEAQGLDRERQVQAEEAEYQDHARRVHLQGRGPSRGAHRGFGSRHPDQGPPEGGLDASELEREIARLNKARRKALHRERNHARRSAPGALVPHRIGYSPNELQALLLQATEALQAARDQEEAAAQAQREADDDARRPFETQLENAVEDYSADEQRHLLQVVVKQFVATPDLLLLVRGVLQHRHARTLARYPLPIPRWFEESSAADYLLAGNPSLASQVRAFLTVPEPEDLFPLVARRAQAQADRQGFQRLIRELHRTRWHRGGQRIHQSYGSYIEQLSTKFHTLPSTARRSWAPRLRLLVPILDDYLLGHPRWDVWAWRTSTDNEGTAGDGEFETQNVSADRGRNWRVGYALAIVLEGDEEVDSRLTAIREGADRG